MDISSLLQQLIVGLVIMTSTGALVQDTKLGRALELTAPLTNLSINVSSHLDGLDEAASAHTHVERASAFVQDVTGMPRVQARDDHRRYYTPKNLSRSSDHSGGSTILWPYI